MNIYYLFINLLSSIYNHSVEK